LASCSTPIAGCGQNMRDISKASADTSSSNHEGVKLHTRLKLRGLPDVPAAAKKSIKQEVSNS
jgi:hypothetical protein